MEKIIVKNKPITICNNLKRCNTFYSRLRGLMFSNNMDNYDGILITPCNSIHTFFMKYSIDVVFLTKDYKIVKIIRNLKPWRMTFVYFNSFQVLEIMSGSLPNSITEQDILEVICTN